MTWPRAAGRNAALARARDAVQSARFRALTIDIAAWLQAGLWTNPQDDLVADQGNVPIEIFASEQLARLWRKVRKKGKLLAQLDQRSRHKLRIQAKKLRYATEFFVGLYAQASGRQDGATNSFRLLSACRTGLVI
jgi:triphosphatase